MFLLKRENPSEEFDEFGWWLTPSESKSSDTDSVSDPEFESEESFATSSRSTISSDTDISEDNCPLDGSCAGKSSGNDGSTMPGKQTLDDVKGMLHPEREEVTKFSVKSMARCYTPERLVRNEDYRIIIPSSTCLSNPVILTELASSKRYNRKNLWRLGRLVDRRFLGASQLEALLDVNLTDIKIPATMTQRRPRTVTTVPVRRYTAKIEDLLSFVERESPRRLVTPELISSGSSCECSLKSRAPANAPHFVVDEIVSVIIEEPRIINGTGSYPSGDGNVSPGISSWRDTFDDSREEIAKGTVNMVQNLQGKIEHLQNRNKDMFEEICLLRKNFQWEERKTGNLKNETTKLRREIRDLRYIDDLVNLLRGQVEDISPKNWPFRVRHANQEEEFNLVV